MSPSSGLPTVSICTPTAGRLDWLPLLHRCLLAQHYPRELLEWVVCDDGPEPAQALLESLCGDALRLVYERPSHRLPLGEKRNRLNRAATGDILVYCDDDDYYPPERVSHAVRRLMEEPEVLMAGSSILPTYFADTGQVWRFGPYGPRHATAGTFAFRRELLRHTAFPPEAGQAEEKAFLHNYRIPLLQLDPAQTILCFNHGQNTFDKRRILPRAGRPAPHAKRMEATIEHLIADADLRLAYRGLFQQAPPGSTPSPVPVPATGSATAKLGGLPLIVYLNCDADTKSRARMEQLFHSLPRPPERLAATTPATLPRHLDAASLSSPGLTPVELAITVSHLRALRRVVRRGADHALIVEDDITCETLPYWRFTLPELIAALPPDWGIVQLQRVLPIRLAEPDGGRQKITPVVEPVWTLHPLRHHLEWGSAAYLIRRDLACALLASYSPDPGADPLPLDLRPYPHPPHSDSLLYAPPSSAACPLRAYSLPLFVPLPKAHSSSVPRGRLQQVMQDYARLALLRRLQQLPSGLTLEAALAGENGPDGGMRC